MQLFKAILCNGIPTLVLLFGVGLSQLRAQDESPAETKYREDYERVIKIKDIPDGMKRAESLLALMKEGPDPRVFDYAQTLFLLAVEGFNKAEKYPQVIALSEKFIKLRPQVGETYYFYGTALKKTNKTPEAIDALAKCSVLRNRASRQATEFLEYIYKSQNNGSLVGLDKVLKKAKDDLAKQ
jgi:tetratricopeptide (TPR) repeat protein